MRRFTLVSERVLLQLVVLVDFWLDVSMPEFQRVKCPLCYVAANWALSLGIFKVDLESLNHLLHSQNLSLGESKDVKLAHFLVDEHDVVVVASMGAVA